MLCGKVGLVGELQITQKIQMEVDKRRKTTVSCEAMCNPRYGEIGDKANTYYDQATECEYPRGFSTSGFQCLHIDISSILLTCIQGKRERMMPPLRQCSHVSTTSRLPHLFLNDVVRQE